MRTWETIEKQPPIIVKMPDSIVREEGGQNGKSESNSGTD